jgi:putative spermidine/putrescine transport system ATP-binding protein/mannopine transport system ATP-binding protein
VTVAVQPGRLDLCAPTDAFCTGTVESVTYVGTLVRVVVRFGGSGVGAPARRQGAAADAIRVEVPARRAPAVGDHVGITADPDNVNVFAAAQGG